MSATLPGRVRTSAPGKYCEVIFELHEDDIDALQVRMAERLGVSRPAVSDMVQRMSTMGLVDVQDGRVALTPAGVEMAEQHVRRHRLAERLLVDVLGLGWAEAHELADSWQQVIDDRTEQAIDSLLGSPATCPHGNPIPGGSRSLAGADLGEVSPLAALAKGQRAQVVRVTERLEVEPGMLVELERAGLVPGTAVEVLSFGSGAMAVRASRDVLVVSTETAAAILVRAGDLVSLPVEPQ
ncbi:MAG: metal-dependent transcriptional regulator [Actinomycetota bacterium]|nr:metal-dependent transcriptional regulator [Actinomycetota bacterium]